MRKQGYFPEPLGHDFSHALQRVEHLNADWDKERKKETAPITTELARRGTIGWLIERHKKSQAYKAWSPHTRREFVWCTELLIKTRDRLASSFERKQVRELYEAMITKGFSIEKSARVMKWVRFLLSQAIEEGLRKDNPAFNLRIEHNPPRNEVWHHNEIAQFVAKAAEMGRQSIGLATMLGFDLGQRQGDILKLSWNQFNGESFFLKQGKTGVRVSVPLLDDMKAILSLQDRKSIQIVMSEETKRPYNLDNFRHHFRAIANAAGFDKKQFIDLRRSSVVRLSLAGATPQLIASITGHSIYTVTQILKIYNPPTIEQARQAISLLEVYMGKQKHTGVGK